MDYMQPHSGSAVLSQYACFSMSTRNFIGSGRNSAHPIYYLEFLVSGRDLTCQQEVSLALTKTPPIHYYNVVDSGFSNYAG